MPQAFSVNKKIPICLPREIRQNITKEPNKAADIHKTSDTVILRTLTAFKYTAEDPGVTILSLPVKLKDFDLDTKAG